MNQKISEKETNSHIYFWDYKYPLSNFYLKEFTYSGKVFISAQQAIYWETAKLFKDYNLANEIIKYSDKTEIKENIQFENFDHVIWMDKCDRLYEKILISKFTNSQLMKEILLSTKNKKLVFCSTDRYWGCGLRTNHPNLSKEDWWTGSNKLGKLLMKIRSKI